MLKKSHWLALSYLFCVTLIVIGFIRMHAYETTPSAAANSPRVSQRVLSLYPHRSNQYVLLMFAHPECPCTHASLDELATLLTHTSDRIIAYVLFSVPSVRPKNWSNTELEHQAASIPGVQILADIDGVQAERFGARTSGQVVLYDPKGHLKFQGGITIARGHIGDNPGIAAIQAALMNQPSPIKKNRVFGCSLYHTEKTSAP